MAGNLTFVPDYSQNLTDFPGNVSPADYNASILHHSTQMLCEPRYTMTTVDVVWNATGTLSAVRSAAFTKLGFNISGVPLDVDTNMRRAVQNQHLTDIPFSFIFD